MDRIGLWYPLSVCQFQGWHRDVETHPLPKGMRERRRAIVLQASIPFVVIRSTNDHDLIYAQQRFYSIVKLDQERWDRLFER